MTNPVKWIRLWGFALFVGGGAALCLGVYLFLDILVERAIEKAGSKIVGAVVELDSAKLTFMPLALELKRLQVSNPREPMTNAVEVDALTFSIETASLIRRKVIINDMYAERVRLSTPRESSGELPEKAGQKPGGALKKFVKKKAAKLKIPALEIPDPRQILENEELETLRLIEELRGDMGKQKEKFKGLLAKLPDKKKLDKYRKRIDGLKKKKKGDILGVIGSAKEIEKLNKEIKRDLKELKKVRKDLKKEFKTLKRRARALKDAPKKDLDRLIEKYSISSKGLKNLSRRLFGAKISEWIDSALAFYKRLKPVVEERLEKQRAQREAKPERGKGINVRFRELRPSPDFVIKRLGGSVELASGSYDALIKNITTEQDVLGLPLEFTISGKELKDIKSIVLSGTLDHRDPGKARDAAQLKVRGFRIKELALSESAKFPVLLKGGTADIDLKGEVSQNGISANLDVALSALNISAKPKDPAGDRVAAAVASAIAGVKEFSLQAIVTGSIDDYDLRLKTDLDKILKQAAGNVVRSEIKVFEKRLKKELMAKVNAPLGSIDKELGWFKNAGVNLNERGDLTKGLLDDLIKGGLRDNKKGTPDIGGIKLPF